MNREKSLKEAYSKLLEVGFGEGSLQDIPQFIDENVMGYGTALDEKIMSIQEFRDLMIDQRKQAVNFDEFSVTSKPVINRISDNGNTAVIVDEVVLLTRIQGESNELSLRMSTVFEFKDGSWKLIHWHGSKPEHISGGDDPWHVNEWKRKNEELQKLVDEKTSELLNKNRELEIETALEKVRAVAMGMKDPANMLDVCKTISNQLQSLGVKEIRNVQTAIFYEQRGTYMNYEYYAKHDKTFITETVFTDSEIHNEFAAKMIKGKGEVYTIHVNGSEVKDWIAYQKTTNVFIDKYLETASSLNYYWFSLGPVALGISTYHPLKAEEIDLFKRFVKVFELAYRRYLDIEKAIAQAQEAQIEASLERVRAVAMGMNKSDDLLSICEVSFNEFKKLGIDNIRNALIHIQYDNQKYFMDYDFSDLTGGAITKIEYGSHPVVEDYLKQIRSAKDAFYQGVIKEDQLEEWKEFRRNSGQINDPRLEKATALYYYFFSIGIGDIGISTFKSIDESQIKILKRFRNVFDLAYRRYNDITLAEEQAREARIEAALEKIRSRALAMRNSSEVGNVSTLLFLELEKMDINPSGFSIMIFDEEQDKYELWRAQEVAHQGAFETFSIKGMYDKFDQYVPGFGEELKSAWTNGNPFFIGEFRGEKRVSFLQANREMANYSDEIFEKMKPGWPDPTFWHLVFFKYGWFGVLQNEQLIKEDLLLIHRFAEVFDFAYTRFLDLKKAEAQAREAQIEASMEKIRSRSLAMQKPEELIEVAELLRKEMGLLGVEELETSSLYIVDEENQKAECWYAIKDIREENKRLVSDEMTLTLSDSWVGNEMWKFYRSKKEKTSIVMKGDNRKEWINYCANKSKVLQGYYGNEIPERTYHLVMFNGGYMGAASPGDISSESWDLLKRAAAVFSLAYTRFKDLQDAEASAREAQIEAALERVRSRTMGMQRSVELKEVIQLIYEQFIQLKIQTEHAGFIMDYKTRDDYESWIADRFGTPSQVTIPYFDCIYYNRFNDAKEKRIDLFTVTLTFEEKNRFYNDLFQHIPRFPEESKKIIFDSPAFAISTVLLENVALYIENFAGTPYSDEDNNTLKRFGKVFQQTYTRFLDLQKAEEQNKIIQTDNDRKTKELEDARQLQLSMLPKALPQLPHLDIAVYMKTATEVGGDYYDFNVDDNGILTVVVGDATGHGMMSGMMVSIMKSFFISNRSSINLKQFFENTNNSLKEMHLGRLMMPLIGVQINSEKLIATNAGMPSLLYFRNKSQKAGEFVSNNLPLGGMKGTKYLLKEIRYEKGDALLLMSDGFAELKNKNNEQYGYQRTKELFNSIAYKSSSEIIEELKNTTSRWLNGAESDDDVTFVVLKVK